jgi:uncharacterized OsmC-like protein
MSLTINVLFPGGKKIDAKIGEVLIKTDQPVAAGGEGSAPEPFQLFLASIATCAGIYASGFCKTRDIDSQGMALQMICEYNHEAKRFTKMKLALQLPPGFPDKYRDGIVRAMDLCTVKRHIINPPEFEIGITEI